jgi:hypothetical protein
MRVSIFVAATLFAILNNAALADTPVGDGWHVAQPAVHSNTPKRLLPHPDFGTGTTKGMNGERAVYVANNQYYSRGASMTRDIPLEAWRGKRIRLSLRLKNEDGARGWAGMSIAYSDTNGSAVTDRNVRSGTDGWQTHRFVVDVPYNATALSLSAGVRGQGKLWVDGITLEAVSADVPVNETRRIIRTAPPGCGARPPYGANCNSF